MQNIRKKIKMKCALAIYKQTILPLFDYMGIMQMSFSVSDKNDLQTIQNNGLQICYNAKL